MDLSCDHISFHQCLFINLSRRWNHGINIILYISRRIMPVRILAINIIVVIIITLFYPSRAKKLPKQRSKRYGNFETLSLSTRLTMSPWSSPVIFYPWFCSGRPITKRLKLTKPPSPYRHMEACSVNLQ